MDLLPFLIIGLTTGSVYGLVGVGLVLTYKTSGVFNFAYGSLAALAAFVFYFLRDQHGVSWPVAVLLAVVGLGLLLGLLLERLAQALTPASTEIKIVSTVGLILFVIALGALWFPGPARQVEPFLPTRTIYVAGVFVGWDQIITFAFACIVTLALYLLFRYSRVGSAMRAVVDNPDLLSRTGENPVRIRQYAWVIGAVLVCASGVLLVPSLQLDPTLLTLLVVQAFGAAAIGGFRNLPLTFFGGLGLGIAAAFATKYAAEYNSFILNDASSALPFVVLFIVLVVTPRARLAERAVKPTVQVLHPWRAPMPVRLFSGAVVVGLLALAPQFAGVRILAYSQVLVSVMILLSVGMLVRMSGQSSLCQLTFAGIGAAAMGHFTSNPGMPWLVAVLLSILVVIPVAALLALPTVRLSGVFLALATLGFGIVVEQVFYPVNWLFGTTALGLSVRRPSGSILGWNFGTDRGYYYVLLVAAVLVSVLIEVIARGRLGRLFAAFRDSPLVLQTNGTTIPLTRLIIFCISAAVAALSGALGATLLRYANASNYLTFSSLFLFVIVVVIAVGSPWYALLAAILINLGPSYATTTQFNAYLNILVGLGAVMYVYVARVRPTIPAGLRQFLDRFGGRAESIPAAPEERVPTKISAPSAVHAVREAKGAEIGLIVSNLTVKFGGVVAVDDFSLKGDLGRITGLIGPNGAGKSTTFNACSGLLRPSAGEITFLGHDITRSSPQFRARMGIGRTFQRAELLDSLTVSENVEIGREARFAGGSPWAQIRASRAGRVRTRDLAEEAIQMTGLQDVRDTQVGLLPTGLRRLVEVARVIAGEYSFVLMDEPSSGLDPFETEEVGHVIKTVVENRGTGVFIVEHDMILVNQICDFVHVLDFGVKIFEGTVTEMYQSDAVGAAYLGSDFAIVDRG